MRREGAAETAPANGYLRVKKIENNLCRFVKSQLRNLELWSTVSIDNVFIFSDKNICHYSKRAQTCHTATSCVRDQNATTAPGTHTLETGSLNLLKFMFQWFIKFPEFIECTKLLFHLGKTSILFDWIDFFHAKYGLFVNVQSSTMIDHSSTGHYCSTCIWIIWPYKYMRPTYRRIDTDCTMIRELRSENVCVCSLQLRILKKSVYSLVYRSVAASNPVVKIFQIHSVWGEKLDLNIMLTPHSSESVTPLRSEKPGSARADNIIVYTKQRISLFSF